MPLPNLEPNTGFLSLSIACSIKDFPKSNPRRRLTEFGLEIDPNPIDFGTLASAVPIPTSGIANIGEET